MFGWTEAEALGQRMDMIMPERLRQRHWDGYDKSMAHRHHQVRHDVLRVPAVDKAGHAHVDRLHRAHAASAPDGKPSA